MPARSGIEQLAPGDRAWLEKTLVENGFSSYQQLADELAARGYAISKSAIHRYGQVFEDNLAKLKLATQQARAIAEALPDDAGELGDALTRLVQQKTFDLLMEMEIDPEKVKITDLGVMISKLNTAGVAQKKWASEVRAKAATAADQVAQVAKAGGLTQTAVNEIRSKILGIVS